MFDYSQFEKQKLERAKILAVHKFSLKPETMDISADIIDETLNEQHIKSIIEEILC